MAKWEKDNREPKIVGAAVPENRPEQGDRFFGLLTLPFSLPHY